MKTHRARTQARKRSPARHRKPLPRELNIGEAKALFSQLVDEAARGARFVIAKAGTPVARIVPLEARSSPAISRKVEVLPQPDGPSKVTRLPFSMTNDTASTAITAP